MERLKEKVVLITGSGRGIGRTAAFKFACEGAKVVIVDIDREAGELTAEEICKKGHEACFIRADVSNKNDVKNVFEIVMKKFNKLQVLYNNASVYLPSEDGRITDIEEEVWDRVVSINLKSIYLFCKHSIPLMIKSGGGSIINTASSAGLIVFRVAMRIQPQKARLSL